MIFFTFIIIVLTTHFFHVLWYKWVKKEVCNFCLYWWIALVLSIGLSLYFSAWGYLIFAPMTAGLFDLIELWRN